MTEKKQEKITCKCPRGHKLRGDTALIGKSVRCPRCKDKFVFGYQVRETVTDTAVVRILGDAPDAPPPPVNEPATRPCSRCGVHISVHTSVCEHCNCYVGLLPSFFSKLAATDGDSSRLPSHN